LCEKETTTYSHNGSAGFRNLKQQWISWSRPVSVETQTRVTEDQKWAVPRRAYRYLRKEWNTDIKNELSNLVYCQTSPIQSFFISCLRLGLLFEACSPNSDLGNAKKSLGTDDSGHCGVNGCIFLIYECLNNKMQLTGKKINFFILVTCFDGRRSRGP